MEQKAASIDKIKCKIEAKQLKQFIDSNKIKKALENSRVQNSLTSGQNYDI